MCACEIYDQMTLVRKADLLFIHKVANGNTSFTGIWISAFWVMIWGIYICCCFENRLIYFVKKKFEDLRMGTCILNFLCIEVNFWFKFTSIHKKFKMQVPMQFKFTLIHKKFKMQVPMRTSSNFFFYEIQTCMPAVVAQR